MSVPLKHDEAIAQQVAAADVLKVISRSAFNLNSVLSTLVEVTTRVCEAERGMVYLGNSINWQSGASSVFPQN